MGIWIGNEQKDIRADLSQEYSRTGIRNTGFYKLDKISIGRYLVIRRDQPTALRPSQVFNLMHLLVFETPNLLQELEGIATITSDTTQENDAVEPHLESEGLGSPDPVNGISDSQKATNLLNNFEQRKCKSNLQPFNHLPISDLKVMAGADR